MKTGKKICILFFVLLFGFNNANAQVEKLTEEMNGNTVADIEVPVKINKVDGSGTLAIENVTYGTAISPITETTTNGTVSIVYKKTSPEDTTYSNVLPKNVGTYTAKATFLATDNYNEFTATADFSITAKELTISSHATVNDKVYDGTNTATTNNSDFAVDGIIGEDSVTVAVITAIFEDINVGTNKEATLTYKLAKDNPVNNNYKLKNDGIYSDVVTTAKITSVFNITIDGAVNPESTEDAKTAAVALRNAINNIDNGGTIELTGIFGFNDEGEGTGNAGYELFIIEKAITVKSNNENTPATIFGVFTLMEPNIIIENLVINVCGGRAPFRNGVNVATRVVTIENCTFNLKDSATRLVNGIGIFPPTEDVSPAEIPSYIITGNTFTGPSQINITQATTAILVAEKIKTGNTFTPKYTSGKLGISEEQELALAKANTYTSCTYGYARQDWSINSNHIITYMDEQIYAGGGKVYLIPGTYKLDSLLDIREMTDAEIKAGYAAFKGVHIIGTTNDENGEGVIITTGTTPWKGTGTFPTGSAALITVNTPDSVILENLTVIGAKNIDLTNVENLENPEEQTAPGNGIHLCKAANVTLKNIVSKDNDAAGILINGSTVTIENLSTSNNESGASISLIRGIEIISDESTSANYPVKLTLKGENNLKDTYQIISSLSDSEEDNLDVTAVGYTKYAIPEGSPYKLLWSNSPYSVVWAESINKIYTSNPFEITQPIFKGFADTEVTPEDLIYTYTGTSNTTYEASNTAPTDAGTYNVSVTTANNDFYTITENSKTFTITAVQLTIAAPIVTTTKDYDGNATATVIVGTLSGVIEGDVENVTVTAKAVYADANVEDNKTITVTYELGGSAAGNYIAPVVDNTVTSGEITTVENITINNGDVVALNHAIANIKDGGTINISGTFKLDSSLLIDRNVAIVGSANEETTITTSDNDWVATDLGSAALITITANNVKLENITVTGAKNITFDGDKVAFGNGIHAYSAESVILKDIVSKDNEGAGILINNSIVAIENLSTSGNASDASIYLMQGEEIEKEIVTKLTLTGENNLEDTYQIITSLIEEKVEVTADKKYTKYTLGEENTPYTFLWSKVKIIQVEWSKDEITKTYDAKQFVITPPTFKETDGKFVTIDATNLVYTYTDEDNVSTTIAPKNAGTYHVSVAHVVKSSNIVFAPNSKAFLITKAALTIANPTLTTEKVYDGTTTAVVVAGKLSGVINKKNVTVEATATYTGSENVENVGDSKTITVVYTLDGADVANYGTLENFTVQTGEITTKFIAVPTAIPVYFNGIAQTGVNVNYASGYSWVDSSAAIEQINIADYTSSFNLTDKINTAWVGLEGNEKTAQYDVSWKITGIVSSEATADIWINGDAKNKIKPTVIKESVKAGTSLSIDVANKLIFSYEDPKTGLTTGKALKYTIISANLTEGFDANTVGTIDVASNKIKFTPVPFYYTAEFGSDNYANNAIKFTYDILVDFNGNKYPATFNGFVAVEPVNQAPRIVLTTPMFFHTIGEDENAETVIKIDNVVTTIDAGVNETTQQTTVAFAETKGLENIKFEDNKLSFKNAGYLEIEKPTVVTINFTVTDTNEQEFGGANAKAMVSKGSIKVTLLPKVWNNAVPTFEIALGENEPFNENAKAATYKIGGLITEISDGETVPGKQKVTFTITTESAASFTKLPTIAVKGKTDGTGTGDLIFTLAPNVNKDVEIKITAHDNGLPIASSIEKTFTIKVKPTTPSVKSFKIVAKYQEGNEISTGNVNEIVTLSADFDFAGRGVTVTTYTWTSGEKTGEVEVCTFSEEEMNALKAGDKVTLEIEFEDDGKDDAKQVGTWTGSFYLGNPEWSPAINLVEILKELDVTAEAEGTYQVSMTQGKIKNKVITSVNSEIPYIKVSEFIASKAKGFLPNAVVAITQIDKFDGKKFGAIYKEAKDTPAAEKIEFITTNYADEADIAFDGTKFENGIFTADITFNDAQGFAYELFAGEEIKGKLAMKKIQNGTITFSDADLRSSNDHYTINPSLFDYKFTHSFTLPKVTANNVKMQIKVKPLNPLFTPKTFTNGTEEPVTFDTMPIAPVNFTSGDGIFPFAATDESVVFGPVSDVKNAKYNVTFSWDSIQNADSYTVEYRLKDAAKWTKKNVKKLTSLVVPFSAGEYEWKITTTTKVEETLSNGKTKISAKTAEFPCGLFKVVTAAGFKAIVN